MKHSLSRVEQATAFFETTSAKGERELLPIEVHNIEYRLDSFRSRTGITLDGFLLDSQPRKLEVCKIRKVIFNDPATIVI